MSPDPVLLERLERSWTGTPSALVGRAERRFPGAAGGRDRRDRFRPARPADRRAGARKSGGGPCTRERSGRSTSCAFPRPTASAWSGAARAGSAPMPWPPARSGSSSWPAGRARAWASKGPKGTFPIGPVSSASLFQIHAEKIVALGRRYGRSLPLYIMTSPENHETTIAFFDQHDRFGLEKVRFFTQGQMPAFDRSTGKMLLAAKDRIALSPDGHGGTLAALAAPGPRAAGRAAWTRCATRACRPSFTSRSIIPWSASPSRRSSACTAKPAPKSRSRSSSGSPPMKSWVSSFRSTAARR